MPLGGKFLKANNIFKIWSKKLIQNQSVCFLLDNFTAKDYPKILKDLENNFLLVFLGRKRTPFLVVFKANIK